MLPTRTRTARFSTCAHLAAVAWLLSLATVAHAALVKSLAGGCGGACLGTMGADGFGTMADMAYPHAVAASLGSSTGPSFFLDGTNAVRTVSMMGEVHTVAGQKNMWPGIGHSFADGMGTNAMFWNNVGACVDPTGNLFIADSNNFRLRKMSPAGLVSTVAGSARAAACPDATANGVGASASFTAFVRGVACTPDGSVFVTDKMTIRKVSSAGVVTTLVGRVYPGCEATGGSDGVGTTALFGVPTGVAYNHHGALVVADWSNHNIRMIDLATAVVRTVAGGRQRGAGGYADGVGSNALFLNPTHVAVDSTGVVFVTDTGNACIRRIDLDGRVSTVAGGNRAATWADGPGPAAAFWDPQGLSVVQDQFLLVADQNNMRCGLDVVVVGILKCACLVFFRGVLFRSRVVGVVLWVRNQDSCDFIAVTERMKKWAVTGLYPHWYWIHTYFCSLDVCTPMF